MPMDRGALEQQLTALGEGTQWWEQREMRDLPTVLAADEQVLGIGRAKVGRILRAVRGTWLVTVTDRRLICLRSSANSNWRQIEIPGGQITRVTLRVGPFHGTVSVVAGSQRIRFRAARPVSYRIAAALTKLAPAKDAATGVTPVLFARRVIDHVLALPAAALDPSKPAPQQVTAVVPLAMDERLQSLEQEVEEMRKQIDFLEQLLRQRHEEITGPAWSRDS